MRTKRHTVIAALAAVVLAAGACGGDDDDSGSASTTTGGPAVSITAPADGTRIKGNVASLSLNVSGITVAKADGDTSGKTGHFHVFIDGEPPAPGAVIDKTPAIVHSADNPVVVPGLSIGAHTLTVVLGDGAHTRLGATKASVKVTVEGPSLDATAPATLAVGQPLSIAATVAGVTLAAANGDTTGATGHLHAFVDVPPVAPGQPIPTGNPAIIHSATSPIAVANLGPGEHTIWIVLGDGLHNAFKDSVRDKVVVTVT